MLNSCWKFSVCLIIGVSFWDFSSCSISIKPLYVKSNYIRLRVEYLIDTLTSFIVSFWCCSFLLRLVVHSVHKDMSALHFRRSTVVNDIYTGLLIHKVNDVINFHFPLPSKTSYDWPTFGSWYSWVTEAVHMVTLNPALVELWCHSIMTKSFTQKYPHTWWAIE